MVKEFMLNSHTKLAIQETPGHKGTIIAVHGLTGNHKTFYHYRKLLEGDYTFISYDLRGRGNSSPADENTSLFKHAEELKTFIEMKKIEKPILMGYSMGAYICALVASEVEVSGLILLDGAGTTEERQRELIIPSLSRLNKSYRSADDYVAQTRDIYASLNVEWDAAVEEITRYEVKETPDGWRHKSEASAMEKDFNSFYDFHPIPVFEKIICPTLLVIAYGPLGKKEPLFTKETYNETIATAKDLVTIEVPANHYTLMFEKQEKVQESILDLLQNIKKVSV
ncbi:alpha/beta hydrolase [Sporosarcina sp. ACRSM]|uniref:alpha/beta fold hydrolase n=1 Tax=Sporosarcina sp. ACRSM TaxID=2918216 RepID=UPI001EF439A2|nr:alpha/beta hydrolase [Sporosarcina sp. ACRSM]MCG7334910.1 alpha/beta hydrolase [Sporosarcina sp. ACRSM]